jgi:hypothetical protein
MLSLFLEERLVYNCQAMMLGVSWVYNYQALMLRTAL